MNPKLKLLLYLAAIGCLAGFGYALYTTYRAAESAAAGQGAGTTNQSAVTQVVMVVTTTNGAAVTNTSVITNAVESTNQVAGTHGDPSDELTPRRSSARLSRLMAYGVIMLFSLVGLSLLIAQDFSKYVANRVDDFIFNDDLKGVKDPEYEEAERVWASGKHLESIQLMRDYLKRHPREQYVALRIAEIYETDLHNYLAAALEYEEVLKKKLPAERWGWAAIHLANIYSGKLNKIEQATALLRRIVDQYGQTAAAKKARDRLGIPQPVEVPIQAAVAEPEPEPAPEPVAPQPPPSNLPPGFRPK
jgi:TolA-binding protein